MVIILGAYIRLRFLTSHDYMMSTEHTSHCRVRTNWDTELRGTCFLQFFVLILLSSDGKKGSSMGRKTKKLETPELEAVEAELQRVKYKSRYRSALRGTIYTLVVVAAVAILVATLWLPFLRIYGTSMSPTLQDGEIICCVKTSDFDVGDIVAFYYNNKLLVKRVIGLPGDWVSIDDAGTVYINSDALSEPYLVEKALGDGDIEFPYQVPDGKLFVLGDHRSTSVDSRHSTVGCIAQEQIVGKILLRIWPLDRITLFR